MIRTVLVPLDGSKAAEAVIPYVELIASRSEASVHLLTVVHDHDGEAKAGEALAYLSDRATALRPTEGSAPARGGGLVVSQGTGDPGRSPTAPGVHFSRLSAAVVNPLPAAPESPFLSCPRDREDLPSGPFGGVCGIPSMTDDAARVETPPVTARLAPRAGRARCPRRRVAVDALAPRARPAPRAP